MKNNDLIPSLNLSTLQQEENNKFNSIDTLIRKIQENSKSNDNEKSNGFQILNLQRLSILKSQKKINKLNLSNYQSLIINDKNAQMSNNSIGDIKFYFQWEIKKKQSVKKQLLSKKIPFPIEISKSFKGFLNDFFCDKGNTDGFNELLYNQKLLVFYIMMRKMKIKCKQQVILENEYFQQIYQKYVSFTSNKWFEENFKFLFNFYKKNWISEKKLEEKDFYEFYFQQTSQQNKIQFSDFLEPTTQKTIKTYGKSYLAQIYKSELFQQDFNQFLQLNFFSKDFKEKYQKNLQKKIHKMFKFLKRTYRRSKNRDIEKIIFQYFTKNRQCKLPWNVQEIQQAAQKIIKKLKKLEIM